MSEVGADAYSPDQLRHLSVARIRELRQRATRRKGSQRLPLLERQDRSGPIPLSFAQERLWFLDQLGLIGSAYNAPLALRLEGPLVVEALERSWTELVARHEILRTHFESVNGSPIQVIEGPCGFHLAVRDLSELPESERMLEVGRLTREAAQERFDLSRGPLFRVALLKLAEDVHVLVVTLHHIISDGWSLGVLDRELGSLYAAFSRGENPSLPELAVQYADYAIWQRKVMQGELLKTHLDYWRQELATAPAELRLPSDRPRPAVPSFAGGRVRLKLPATLMMELQALARAEGATLFMVLLAAYHVLLSRYSGQDECVIGSPIAGRTPVETEDLIGFFVNTLAFRSDLSGNPSFRRLLRSVADVTLRASEYRDLPFERLVSELRPERSLTRQPIFQVVLALQNYPHEELQLAGITWSRMEIEPVTAAFDLTVLIQEGTDGADGYFDYAADLFDQGTIERLAQNFRQLLQALVADPDRAIQNLPLLATEELAQVVHKFNDTVSPYPRNRLIHELFEDWVERTPDAIALVCEGQAITYRGLNAHANQLAHHLVRQGVQLGEYIALVIPRSFHLLVAELAVLKCGAAYVPIDSALPPERQSVMLRDCAARRVLADTPRTLSPAYGNLEWIDCTECAGITGKAETGNLNRPQTTIAPAYVMYTSGSTGIPRGVVVPHFAVNRLAINNGYAEILPTDCLSHCSNPMFDASTLEVWGALLNGARVAVVDAPVVLDPDRLLASVQAHEVTVFWLTIGLFAQYLDVLAPALGQFRCVLTGGDVVDPTIVRRVRCGSPPLDFRNAYGPTECTTFTTTYSISSGDETVATLPIGRPIANAQVYILDRHLQPVPIGVIGELYIGGEGLAICYLNRAELTAERFVANPFSKNGSERLYRTGDLGRWRADGNIEFRSRNDRQVKLRGFRIEVGEIEARLAQCENVREAVVVVREDRPGDRQLVAYVTAPEAHKPNGLELREKLRHVLPEYMVPSAIVILDHLPITVTGKIDRNALPAPDVADYGSGAGADAPPQGQIESRLGEIWEAVLGVQDIGRYDSFFALGGHSLLVLKTLYQINETFGCNLKASDFYRTPTLHELANRIQGAPTEDALVDLAREAELVASIRPQQGRPRMPAQAVFVTGATGFVGRFLVAQLLQSTDAVLHCMVRAETPYEALSRLRSVLESWNLWREEWASRIVAVPGDLRQPRLGLDAATYEWLAHHIDSIYHCATSMNHLETYAMARSANVEGTQELLKLATVYRPVLFNYMSTLGVFENPPAPSTRVVNERSSIDAEKHRASNGYVASKWVGERIVMNASERGVPCNIFRLGLVWADTEQGRYDELQRGYRTIKSCLLSGYGIRNFRYEMPPTPVDYVVRAVVCLATEHPSGQGVFHISSPYQMTEGFFERCNEIAATSLQLLPFPNWVREIQRLDRVGRALPVAPLIEFTLSTGEGELEEVCDTHARRVEIDCSQTYRELERAGVVAPVLNDELLLACIENLRTRDPELRTLAVHRSDETRPLAVARSAIPRHVATGE